MFMFVLPLAFRSLTVPHLAQRRGFEDHVFRDRGRLECPRVHGLRDVSRQPYGGLVHIIPPLPWVAHGLGLGPRQVEQQVILEVRQAARNLRASQEGIESAERASEAAQEQLRAQRIRHEYGESTPFDVLQREADLVDREVERIEAYRAYRSSATALDRAQGTILRNRNIRIEEASVLR